ncbi:MAG: protoporphyrinogen oxidase [Cyclobacteriaceae bacterium]|nr:protoporphyrinogen oxidase [Cyclobacteriaceae bacterium]
MKDKKTSIAVIGGGISGLTAAYWLMKKGHSITLFEKKSQVGGSIITERTEGYLVDYGPNSTLETSTALTELIRELGLEGQKIYGNEASNKRYIVRDGNLHPVPMKPGSFLTTRLFSLRSKLGLLMEPFIRPTAGDDISLADFVRHRLGDEFLDYAINPFVAGVYAGDPEKLSTSAAFPKLYALEKKYGSLIRGAIGGARERKKRNEVAKDRAKLFSFRDGMEVLPNKLAEKIGSGIVLNAEIKKIFSLEDGFQLDYLQHNKAARENFDRVLVAIPSKPLASLVGPLNPGFAAELKSIYYPPVAVVFTGFRASDVIRPLDGFGFLVPEIERRQILGSIWSSTIFPGRAPEGHVAFTTFVGGTRQPENTEMNETLLLKLVIDELNDLVGLRNEPVFTRMKKWAEAIPQYNVGYGKIQDLFTHMENEFPGLFIAGNIRKGISVGDSILCAHETVQKMNET